MNVKELSISSEISALKIAYMLFIHSKSHQSSIGIYSLYCAILKREFTETIHRNMLNDSILFEFNECKYEHRAVQALFGSFECAREQEKHPTGFIIIS